MLDVCVVAGMLWPDSVLFRTGARVGVVESDVFVLSFSPLEVEDLYKEELAQSSQSATIETLGSVYSKWRYRREDTRVGIAENGGLLPSGRETCRL